MRILLVEDESKTADYLARGWARPDIGSRWPGTGWTAGT